MTEEIVTKREEFLVVVNGEEINLNASGREQIRRLSKTTEFLRVYGQAAIADVDFSGMTEGNTAQMTQLVINFVGSLDEDGLIMIGEIVSAKDREWVEENFDLEWIVEGLDLLLQSKAFRKIIDAFFGEPE